MPRTAIYLLRLWVVALLAVALAACQTSGAPAPPPTAVGAVNTSATSAPAAPTAQPAATTAPPATAVSVAATPAVGMTSEQAIKAALLAQYPGAAIRIQCADGDFAGAAVAPLGGQHGFDAYLHQQSGAWAIVTNGVDISRESLIKLGFPESFCAMPAAPPTPLPDIPPASSPLVGPEWTLLVTGDLDRNGREDVVAFKPAPITPEDPDPGSQPNDVFVGFRELVVVERAADGAPAVRLLIDTRAVLADNQAIARIPDADRPTSGVMAEMRYPDRNFELRLIDDTGAPGLPFLLVRYSDEAGAYIAEAAGANRIPLSIGALTIDPSESAPAGPESGPPARLVRAGTTVALSIPVQGARFVTFFADGLGQSGNRIGGSADLSGGHADLVWRVPAGVGQLALYAQAIDGFGGVVSSAQVPLVVSAPVSSEYDAPEALLRALYDAVNAKDYARAYGYWETPPTPTLEEFAQGYADTASIALLLGPTILEGAAGSQFGRIPIVLSATSTAGHVQMFSGCYVAHNAVIDASPGGKWLLSSAAIAPAPPNVTTKQLLAQGCQS